eukprot:2648730-Pleurochrysis_carterae.AAC.1
MQLCLHVSMHVPDRRSAAPELARLSWRIYAHAHARERECTRMVVCMRARVRARVCVRACACARVQRLACNPRRVSDEPRVETDREHAACAALVGLCHQRVDGIAAKLVEVGRGGEGAARRELGVVGAKGVRDHQLSPQLQRSYGRCPNADRLQHRTDQGV